MKYIRTIILLLWCLAYMAFAAPVTLAWDAPPEHVGGYQLRYGTDPAKLSDSVLVDDTTATLDLPPGEYHFEVVAVAGAIKSDPSNRITHTIRPDAPTRFRVVIEATVTVSPIAK